MIELLQSPVFTMLLSGIVGFFMKSHALKEERMMNALTRAIELGRASTESADAAARRHDAGGKWNVRFLVLMVVSAAVGLCFVPGLLNISSVVQTTREGTSFLFGLWKTADRVEFTEIQGIYNAPEMWLGFGHIISFFFGQRAAKP
jgi:F0F1-type ATP synthase membrane subunit c/vacuolar-type H+-ATPase subunit K